MAGVAVGIALVGSTGVAVAATGGTFLLGKANTASTTTTLTNSAGTPLSLKAPTGKAPFAVSNSVKVPLLNSDKVDGLDSLQLQRRVAGTCPTGQAARAVTTLGSLGCTAVEVPLRNRISVSASTAPFVSGVALRGALANITDSSATNPYAVYVGPGIFDAAAAGFDVPAFVSLVGAGRTATELRSTRSFCDVPIVGTVTLAVGASAREVAVVNTFSGDCAAVGVAAAGSGLRTLANATVAVKGSAMQGSAGVYALDNAVLVVDVVDVVATNEAVTAYGAISSFGARLTMTGSSLRAGGAGPIAAATVAGGLLDVSYSLLEGLVSPDGATVRCAFNHDAAYAPKSC